MRWTVHRGRPQIAEPRSGAADYGWRPLPLQDRYPGRSCDIFHRQAPRSKPRDNHRSARTRDCGDEQAGRKPDSLSDSDEPMTENHQVDLLAGESLTRFDKAKKRRNRSRVATKLRTTRMLRLQTPTINSLQTTSKEATSRLQPRTGSSAGQKASSNVRRTSHSSNVRRASRNNAKRVNNSSALITSHSVTPNLNALMLMATSRNRRTTVRGSADLSSRGMVETETADSVVVRENLTLPNSRSRRKPMTAATSKITTTQICTSDTPYYI